MENLNIMSEDEYMKTMLESIEQAVQAKDLQRLSFLHELLRIHQDFQAEMEAL